MLAGIPGEEHMTGASHDFHQPGEIADPKLASFIDKDDLAAHPLLQVRVPAPIVLKLDRHGMKGYMLTPLAHRLRNHQRHVTLTTMPMIASTGVRPLGPP